MNGGAKRKEEVEKSKIAYKWSQNESTKYFILKPAWVFIKAKKNNK